MPKTAYVSLTADEVIVMLINEFRNALTNTFHRMGIEPNKASASVIEWMVHSKSGELTQHPEFFEPWATAIHDILEKENHRGCAPWDKGGPKVSREEDIWLTSDPPHVSDAILDVMFTGEQKSVFTFVTNALKPVVH